MKTDTRSKTVRSLTASFIAILLLCFCLAFTTFALVYSMVEVENNFFKTSTVEINLNDGRSIINNDEFLFEPGMTVKKDFFVENVGTSDIYYRLYFQNVDGGLAKALQVTVYDGDKLLYLGTPATLSRDSVLAADDILTVGERRNLQIQFYFPPEMGNSVQDIQLSFDFAADAVQVKNNENKEF